MVDVVSAEASDLPDTVLLFARVLREVPYYNALAKGGEARKYTAAALGSRLAEDPDSILVAKGGDDEIVGFSISHFDDYTIWIDWFGVDTTRRHSGVGTALLKRTIETAPVRGAHKVWCDTRTINEPSKRLLRKMGFTSLVEIKNHWYGQDFILWERLV